jgi:hypothetical protein
MRIDWYAAPGHQSCGIKQREGCLELKLRLKNLGRQAFADASGVLEQWCKWSLPLAEVPAAPDLQITGWTAVEKTRFLVYFCIRSDNVQQLDQCPELGYQFEWTELKVQGQHWLTMGLETLGDSSKLADRFSSVLEHIAPQLDHYPLDTTHSYAYPDWLSQLR